MIITISREFGSGGRELGKRLAEELNIPCYDNEIIVGQCNRLKNISYHRARRIAAEPITRSLMARIIGSFVLGGYTPHKAAVMRRLLCRTRRFLGGICRVHFMFSQHS